MWQSLSFYKGNKAHKDVIQSFEEIHWSRRDLQAFIIQCDYDENNWEVLWEHHEEIISLKDLLKWDIVGESQDDWKQKDKYHVFLTFSTLGCSSLEVVMTANISIKGFTLAPDTPRSGQQGNITHLSNHQHWWMT